MATGAYVGVNGVARKVKAQYAGVAGTARKVKNGYVGVNGVARKMWAASTVPAISSFSCELQVAFLSRYGNSQLESCTLSFSKSGSEYVSSSASIQSPSDSMNVDNVCAVNVPSEVADCFDCLVLTANSGSITLPNDGGGSFSLSYPSFFPLQGGRSHFLQNSRIKTRPKAGPHDNAGSDTVYP